MIRSRYLLLATGLLALSFPLGLSGISESFAQPADDDDPDEDGGDDDDDGDVPDPDDDDGDNGSDPDAGGDGGSDPGGDDGAGDDGGSDSGGDDGSGGGTDGGNDGGDDDDGGSAGGSTGDDDDDDAGSAASGGTGDDDDDGPATAGGPGSGDDDDDDGGDDSPAGPGSPAAGDDDDDSGGGDDGGDDGGSGPEILVGGGGEGEDERAQLDERDGIDVDRDGFRYRKNEFVAVDLTKSDIALLQAEGFRVLETAPLPAIGSTISLIKSPTQKIDEDALSQIEALSDTASVSFNYLFDASTARIKKAVKGSGRKRTACGCDIGLIDTGVATKAGKFKHADIQQKAFNGTAIVPKVHGTGIAYLFAGTENGKGKKRTRVFVGDIFGSDRSKAGSSFALVKALDWMGQMKVPVINVSLAGPKSAALSKAIDGLTRKGHIVVAAAGNDGPAAPPVFPGAYAGVVAVTAVDSKSNIYRYANRGNYIDLSSYGVEVPMIDEAGNPMLATGTSFASPTVAQILARSMSKPDTAAAKAAIAKIEKGARDLGAKGYDTIYGHGLVSD